MILDLLDKESIILINDLYPDFGGTLLIILEKLYEKYQLTPRVTQALRTIEEQDAIYAQGRSKPGKIVTNAVGGSSWHNYGLAADICFRGEDPYLEKHPKRDEIWSFFGSLCNEEGCIWGGHFSHPDQDHCEKRYGLTIKEAFEFVSKRSLKDLWAKIDFSLPEQERSEGLH